MIQKVIKVGNSSAVTIPKDVLAKANIKTGEEVVVEYNEASGAVVVSTSKKPITSLSPDIAQWTKSFIDNNKKALEELANK